MGRRGKEMEEERGERRRGSERRKWDVSIDARAKIFAIFKLKFGKRSVQQFLSHHDIAPEKKNLKKLNDCSKKFSSFFIIEGLY